MKHADIAIDRARHARIKYELALRDLSLADIARIAGVSLSTVSSVSIGKSKSAKVEKHLAAAIDLEPAGLFPDRYQQTEGEPQ